MKVDKNNSRIILFEEGDNLVIHTTDTRKIYVLFVEGKLTVSNESGVENYIASFYDDGSIDVEEQSLEFYTAEKPRLTVKNRLFE